MNNNILFDAITGVLYFAIVYTLIKLVQPYGALYVVGVLYACTFLLYWYVYKVRSLKIYLTGAAMLGGILGAFYWAGKQGMLAALGVYLLVLCWALYARRNKIKQAYKIFETEADKVFFPKNKTEDYWVECNKCEEVLTVNLPKKKVVKAKKPSRTTKKNKTEHKHKQKARKQDSHKASKSSTVKKNSKKRAKKATTK